MHVYRGRKMRVDEIRPAGLPQMHVSEQRALPCLAACTAANAAPASCSCSVVKRHIVHNAVGVLARYKGIQPLSPLGIMINYQKPETS